ncbi:MAG: hypothetical protein ACUVRM_06175, partial [Bacillota bacterium]
MKRFSTVLMLSCLVFSFVVGMTGVSTKSPTVITFYLWDDPTYTKIVEAFNSSQKEIFVKATILPAAAYETKLLTLLAGGMSMDCYMQKRQADMFPQFANGFIEPLDKYYYCVKYGHESLSHTWG